MEEQFREIVRSVLREEFGPILETLQKTEQSGSGGLVTINDVCQRLGISRTTCYQMRRRGDLEAVNIGGTVRFREEDIDALMQSQ